MFVSESVVRKTFDTFTEVSLRDDFLAIKTPIARDDIHWDPRAIWPWLGN